MDELAITVLHSLPGRMRIQLSRPPQDIENMHNLVMGHAGISTFRYTSITRSVLICFNPKEVTLQEILLRAAIALSQEYGLMPVKISAKPETREMSELVYYSGIALAAALVGRFSRFPANLQTALNLAASLGTTGAVLEHAWTEARRRGVYDPEVLSVVYLISSIVKGEVLPAAILTWVTTFGRHLLRTPAESIVVQAFQVKDMNPGSGYYDVILSPERGALHGVEWIRFFLNSLAKALGGYNIAAPANLTRQLRELPLHHGGILEGMGGIGKGIIVRLA